MRGDRAVPNRSPPHISLSQTGRAMAPDGNGAGVMGVIIPYSRMEPFFTYIGNSGTYHPHHPRVILIGRHIFRYSRIGARNMGRFTSFRCPPHHPLLSTVDHRLAIW
jgi:hypothetical protein